MCLHCGGAPAVHVFTGCPHQTTEAAVREGNYRLAPEQHATPAIKVIQRPEYPPLLLSYIVLHTHIGLPMFMVFQSPLCPSDKNRNHALMSSLETQQASWEAAVHSLSMSFYCTAHIQSDTSNDATRLNTHRLEAKTTPFTHLSTFMKKYVEIIPK